MPQSPGQQSHDTSSDFGANEWLVEEMFEQYERDPDSVTPEWKRYFQSNGQANGTTAASPAEKPAPEAA